MNDTVAGARTPADSPPGSLHGSLHGEAALVRVLGPVALAAAIINIIVGAGIFMLPALLSARLGSAAPLAFVAGALAIVPIALCFAAVGSRAAATGGPYTYARAAFGPFAGFVTGALMWICNVASSAGVAAALSTQVANALPAFAQPLPRAVLLLAVYAALFALNAFGVRLGARAINLLAALKLTPLFALALVGLWFVDWSQISWGLGELGGALGGGPVGGLGAASTAAPAFAWSALGSSMVLVIFAYSGMETALIPSGELRDPSRHVPRATLAAVALVVLLYVGIQVVSQGLLGPALPASTAPVADAAGTLWTPARALLLVTAAVSMTGFLMGNLFASSRLLFALGRDGYLPAAFGAVDAVHRVPRLALAAHAVVGLVLAVAGSFESLALISGGAICLVYALVALAAWRAQAVDLRERGAPFVLRGGPLVPALAVLTMAATLLTLSGNEWSAIAVSLAVLVAVYALLAWRRR